VEEKEEEEEEDGLIERTCAVRRLNNLPWEIVIMCECNFRQAKHPPPGGSDLDITDLGIPSSTPQPKNNIKTK